MAPSVALAEEGASGADILLPKPAEFVPALIAFLIIFAVVAKFVWPSVLRMLDKRQEKIQGDLDAAAKSREEANKDREIAAAGIDAAKQQANEIVSAAKREGADVLGVVAIFTYELPRAEKNFSDAGVRLVTLSNYTELIKLAEQEGYVSAEGLALLEKFKHDQEYSLA